jgi:hypothetical protein
MRLGGPALRVAFALCSVLASSANAQTFPRLQEENLNGEQVVLPDAAAGKVAVLICGFTRGSQTSTGSWAKRVQADYGKTASIAWYQLPVLEEAPRLIRGAIVSGMKKGVVADIHANFVPVMHDEAELKKLWDTRRLTTRGLGGCRLCGVAGEGSVPSEVTFTDPQVRITPSGELLAPFRAI